MSDVDNQDTLLRISSFASTHSDEEPTTLAEYVERMKDGQEQIFYATGQSREQLLKSPHLEAFKAKGYEVLLLTDPVDEVWVESVTEFDGKPLQSVAKGEVDLDSEDEKAAHDAERQEQEQGLRRPADLAEGDVERTRQRSAAVHPPDRIAGLPDHRRLRNHTCAGAHVPGFRPGGPGRQADPRTQPEASARHRPSAGEERTAAETTLRWPKPPNCSTAQRFSPRATYPRTRRSSPGCSQTAWLAPSRRTDRAS